MGSSPYTSSPTSADAIARAHRVGRAGSGCRSAGRSSRGHASGGADSHAATSDRLSRGGGAGPRSTGHGCRGSVHTATGSPCSSLSTPTPLSSRATTRQVNRVRATGSSPPTNTTVVVRGRRARLVVERVLRAVDRHVRVGGGPLRRPRRSWRPPRRVRPRSGSASYAAVIWSTYAGQPMESGTVWLMSGIGVDADVRDRDEGQPEHRRDGAVQREQAAPDPRRGVAPSRRCRRRTARAGRTAGSRPGCRRRT